LRNFILNYLDVAWAYVYDTWRANWPCRTTSVIVLLVGFLLIQAPAQDLFIAIGEDTLWSLRVLSVLVTVVAFIGYIWFWTRLAVTLRYDSEPDRLKQYRKLFPARGHLHDPEGCAETRTKWILALRDCLPVVYAIIGLVAVAGPIGLAASNAEQAGEGAAASTLRQIAWIVLSLSVPVMIPVIIHLWIGQRMKSATKQPGYETTVKKEWSALGPSVRWSAYAMAAVVLAFYIWMLADPVAFGTTFPSVFVVFVVATAFLVVGTIVCLWQRHVAIPLAVVLLLVFVIWSRFIEDKHGVRAITSGQEQVALGYDKDGRTTPEEAAEKWMRDVGGSAQPAGSERGRVPFVVVATAGGGARAAYWTATILGRISDRNPEFRNYLFAVSGVSGGSVGAAVYRSLLTLRDKPSHLISDGQLEAGGQFVTSVDSLGPVVAAMFGRDTVLSAFGLEDRGIALERTWERRWQGNFNDDSTLGDGFMTLWPSGEAKPWPALLLNATVVETGGRAIVSNLRLDGANWRSVADVLAIAGRDIPTSTAANLSARFPFLDPAGRLANAGVTRADIASIRLVDGGYFENFGAETALGILADSEKMLTANANSIVPIVIQISSDPAINPQLVYPPEQSVGAVEALHFALQLSAPPVAFYNTRTSHGEAALKRLRDRALEIGHYFHFAMCVVSQQDDAAQQDYLTPVNRFRTQGPPLSWALSQHAQKEMREDFLQGDGCHKNRQKMECLLALLNRANEETVGETCKGLPGFSAAP
jgi:hypothetical protein